MQQNDHEWKREVHEYIDEQIEEHNTANQREFQRLRDGQLALQSDISNLETKMTADISSLETKVTADLGDLATTLTSEIRLVRDASAEAHQEIIARLERLENGKNSPE